MNKRLAEHLSRTFNKRAIYNELIDTAKQSNSIDDFIKNINGKEFTVPIDFLIPSIPDTTFTDEDSMSIGAIEIEPPTIQSDSDKWFVDDGNHRYWEALHRGDETIKAKVSPSAYDVSNFGNEENKKYRLQPISYFWNKAHNK